MGERQTGDQPPERSEVIRAVRIFGGINLVLGLYMIFGALLTLRGLNLPGSAVRMTAGIIGILGVIFGWGSAVVSGVGLIFVTRWGRSLGILWGKIIVWLLPIAFGLSMDGLSNLFSLSFAIIIVICLYARVAATNLARPEFDLGFES